MEYQFKKVEFTYLVKIDTTFFFFAEIESAKGSIGVKGVIYASLSVIYI